MHLYVAGFPPQWGPRDLQNFLAAQAGVPLGGVHLQMAQGAARFSCNIRTGVRILELHGKPCEASHVRPLLMLLIALSPDWSAILCCLPLFPSHLTLFPHLSLARPSRSYPCRARPQLEVLREGLPETDQALTQMLGECYNAEIKCPLPGYPLFPSWLSPVG